MAHTHKIIRTQGQRIAWTNTSLVPDAEVIKAIKFVAQHTDLSKTVIHVKRSVGRSASGWAYPQIPRMANLDGLKRHEWRYLITLAGRLNDHGEMAISTLAHEARHVDQFRTRRIDQLKRERQCETDARAFAHWVRGLWISHCAKVRQPVTEPVPAD